jgi:hypothetical protein
MLDAGPAIEYGRDVYISEFETITIRKLLSSPHYLGRSYLRTSNHTEKYIKNKEICDLIDKLRYKPESRKLPFIQQDYANLHYKGYHDNIVDGGFASTSYRFVDKLDLGNANPPRKANYEVPKQLDLGSASSQEEGHCDLGNAYPPRKATIDLNEEKRLDLGDAYRPQQCNYNLGNAYPPQGGNCEFPGKFDLGNASLSHEFNCSPCS